MLSSLSVRILSSRAPAAASSRLLNSNSVGRCVGIARNNIVRPTTSRRPISITPFILDQITVNVPSLGDSITDGTIVEWCVPPGSHVREGDVVALVETDKVTVDIKADREGVLVKQLGEVDGVMEVGEGLYVLDTDVSNAGAAVAVENTDMSEVNASLDAEKIAAAPEVEAVVAAPSAALASSERVPSIHFLGKEGWKERLAATGDASSSATTMVVSDKPHAPTSITNAPYSPMFGRPAITDDEMEALMLGGADEAPEVRQVVSKEGVIGVRFVGGKLATAGPRGVWLAA